MCSRLDMYVREKMNISRQKAQQLIASGCVYVNGKKAEKASLKIDSGDNVSVDQGDKVLKYVGRGGYKLEKACEKFGIALEGCVCIDIGASTGGFTDCMLQRGAKKVYSVDVGSCQLDEGLKNDSRVISLENTDIRNADTERVDFIGCDVSFISLKHIFPHIRRLLKEKGRAVVLIKPQFEAGKEAVGKRGVVKSPKVHKRVIADLIENAEESGLYPKALDYSPIKGGDGNIEYIMLLSGESGSISIKDAELVIKNAFEGLNSR